MVITRSPEARDENRPFSGPPTEEAGCASDVSVPSAEQLKALIELKESSPDDFLKLVECAKGASKKRETDFSVYSQESGDTTAGVGMETSSDGGSTVRELNQQLEDSNTVEDGNGSVSNAGNLHTSESEWQFGNKRSRRRSKSVSSDGSAHNVNKKYRIENDFTVFIKGSTFDIAKEASRQPIEFSRKLSNIAGKVGQVKLVNSCVRVTCTSPKQKTVLLNLSDWSGKPITVTEPWAKVGPRATNQARPRFNRGIIFGVSTELTEYEIQSETKADIARRIVVFNSSGNRVRTGSVVLSFVGELPEYVYLGCLRFKVKPYIPQPTRCAKCQGYGHIAAYCRRQVRCVRCGEGHSVSDCPVKDDLTQAVCVNCKGQHSAAFKGCSKYQEVSKALKISVTQKVSYRDALIKVKSGVLQGPSGEDSVRGLPVHTSTPLPAPVPPTSRPVPSSTRSPASRQLFSTTSTRSVQPAESNEQDRTASATKTTSDDAPRQNYIPLTAFLKQITHHLLYTLAILDGSCPDTDFTNIRRNLNALACTVFGQHGPNPCLSPNCRHRKD